MKIAIESITIYGCHANWLTAKDGSKMKGIFSGLIIILILLILAGCASWSPGKSASDNSVTGPALTPNAATTETAGTPNVLGYYSLRAL